MCQKAGNFLWYSMALGESNDISSSSQLIVFIGGVNLYFQITGDLTSVFSMHGTTTGKDMFIQMQKTLPCVTFSGIIFDVLHLMEEKHGWNEADSGGSDQDYVGRSLTPGRSVYTHYIISKHSVDNT